MGNEVALNPSVNAKRFGENLKKAMEKKNITADQLRRRIPVGSVQTVYKWMEGKSIPDHDTMCALIKILGVDYTDDLLQPEFHEQELTIGMMVPGMFWKSPARENEVEIPEDVRRYLIEDHLRKHPELLERLRGRF